ncbi:hypothetical protein BJ742DRAFT_822012 [Cladochytrium replicatum]|nr:hypothetical protein BJ742DRAFT_822012 [Cladochytrium replicatum]
MTLTIYNSPIAYNTARLRIVVHEKNLADYKFVDVDILNGDSVTPEYLKVNPNAWVPTIVVPDGKTYQDSVSASRYVDALDGKRLGEGIVDLKVVDEWVDLLATWDGNRFVRANGPAGLQQAIKDGWNVKIKAAAENAKKHPELTALYEQKIKQLTHDINETPEEIKETNDLAASIIAKAEATLSKHKFLAGDAYSLADAHFTILLNLVAITDETKAKYIATQPKVAAYFDAVKARPSFGKTYA